MLAVTGSASGASVVFHSHVAASLLAEGTNLASKLFGKFQTTSSQFQHQGWFAKDGTFSNRCNALGRVFRKAVKLGSALSQD